MPPTRLITSNGPSHSLSNFFVARGDSLRPFVDKRANSPTSNASARRFASAVSHMRACAYESDSRALSTESFTLPTKVSAAGSLHTTSTLMGPLGCSPKFRKYGVLPVVWFHALSMAKSQHGNFTSQSSCEGRTKCLSMSSNVPTECKSFSPDMAPRENNYCQSRHMHLLHSYCRCLVPNKHAGKDWHGGTEATWSDLLLVHHYILFIIHAVWIAGPGALGLMIYMFLYCTSCYVILTFPVF